MSIVYVGVVYILRGSDSISSQRHEAGDAVHFIARNEIMTTATATKSFAHNPCTQFTFDEIKEVLQIDWLDEMEDGSGRIDLRKIKDQIYGWMLETLAEYLDCQVEELKYMDNGALDLSGADLSGKCLTNFHLIGVNLSGANLDGASLSCALMHCADLSGASLVEAKLNSARLLSADLSNANLAGVNFDGADLSDVDLRGAHFEGWSGSLGEAKSLFRTEWSTDNVIWFQLAMSHGYHD